MMKSGILVVATWLMLNPSAHGENWPRFRGPTGQGLSRETNLPSHWTAQSNVVWKTAIPGDGWSSPIVWEKNLYLTSATDGGVGCHVLCLDRDTGKILWDKAVLQQITKRKENKNSYATPTPVCDGQRVYTVFGDGSFAALDLRGEVSWVNRDFPHYSQHGLGASPIPYEDLLIMPRDGSTEEGDKYIGWQKPWDKSFIVALDKNTGKVKWKASRGMSRIAHVTPAILREKDVAQLISGAGDVVQGFDVQTGERLWTFTSLGEGVVPSIVVGDGLVYSVSGFTALVIRAVRTGGAGDVSGTHLAWEQKKNGPAMASLLWLKPYVYSVNEGGTAMCLEEATGKIVWQNKLGGHFSASPVAADNRIYFLSEEGETTVIAAGPEFKEIARNPLNEPAQASMAVSGGRLFIRTEKNVYCLGSTPGP